MFPVETVRLIADALSSAGIKNKKLQAGILAVVSTEGGFSPRSESSYSHTDNKRLRTLFGSRLIKYDEQALETIKHDDIAFYEAIYGGRGGNSAYGDGFKYRGRGFNQITYRGAYEKYGTKIGVDLVTNPDKLNEPKVAAAALAQYFKDFFTAGKSVLKSKYGVDDLSKVEDLGVATKIAFNANAGWGINIDANSALVEEHKKQLNNVGPLYEIINNVA